MRDKLINHAIRQAFEGLIAPESYPAFVLYLTLPHQEVDVNVHPAKHEVRFHQSRMVHDFIFRAITDVLEQNLGASEEQEPAHRTLTPVEPAHDYIVPLRTENTPSHVADVPRSQGSSAANFGSSRPSGQAVSRQGAQAYQSLMKAPEVNTEEQGNFAQYVAVGSKWLMIIDSANNRAVNIADIQKRIIESQFENEPPVSQPLLMPVSIDATPELMQRAQSIYEYLMAFNVEIGWSNKRILVRKVPAGYRQYDWAGVLSALLEKNLEEPDALKQMLVRALADNTHTDVDVSSVFSQLQFLQPDSWTQTLDRLARPIPLEKWLDTLNESD